MLFVLFEEDYPYKEILNFSDNVLKYIFYRINFDNFPIQRTFCEILPNPRELTSAPSEGIQKETDSEFLYIVQGPTDSFLS